MTQVVLARTNDQHIHLHPLSPSLDSTVGPQAFESARLLRSQHDWTNEQATSVAEPPSNDDEAQLDSEASLSDYQRAQANEPQDHEETPASSINNDDDREETTNDQAGQSAENLHLLDQHNLNLRAMHDMFERRQLLGSQAPVVGQQNTQAPLQSSQELSPISIGLEPPFGLASPFSLGASGQDAGPPPPPSAPQMSHKPQMANADNLDPALPFGLSPLPHLLGFQGGPAPGGFDGPQRGDQSAHSNQHASAPVGEPVEPASGQKVWPKIFRFTDGRINLSDFEKHKKIRLSNKNQHGGENHIESAPIMFDGRQLKRKSFLILHGGIFSRR